MTDKMIDALERRIKKTVSDMDPESVIVLHDSLTGYVECATEREFHRANIEDAGITPENQTDREYALRVTGELISQAEKEKEPEPKPKKPSRFSEYIKTNMKPVVYSAIGLAAVGLILVKAPDMAKEWYAKRQLTQVADTNCNGKLDNLEVLEYWKDRSPDKQQKLNYPNCYGLNYHQFNIDANLPHSARLEIGKTIDACKCDNGHECKKTTFTISLAEAKRIISSAKQYSCTSSVK